MGRRDGWVSMRTRGTVREQQGDADEQRAERGGEMRRNLSSRAIARTGCPVVVVWCYLGFAASPLRRRSLTPHASPPSEHLCAVRKHRRLVRSASPFGQQLSHRIYFALFSPLSDLNNIFPVPNHVHTCTWRCVHRFWAHGCFRTQLCCLGPSRRVVPTKATHAHGPCTDPPSRMSHPICKQLRLALRISSFTDILCRPCI